MKTKIMIVPAVATIFTSAESAHANFSIFEQSYGVGTGIRDIATAQRKRRLRTLKRLIDQQIKKEQEQGD